MLSLSALCMSALKNVNTAFLSFFFLDSSSVLDKALGLTNKKACNKLLWECEFLQQYSLLCK